MKQIKLSQVYLFFFFILTLTGCEIVGGIFKAGVWVGIIIVVAVVVLVLWLIKKML